MARRGTCMANRIKVLWLPGLTALPISLVGRWVFPKFWLGPSMTLGDGLFHFWVYCPWFLSLVAAGALASYLSRRLGGRLAYRPVACLFPAYWEAIRLFILVVVFPNQPPLSSAELIFGLMTRIVVPSAAARKVIWAANGRSGEWREGNRSGEKAARARPRSRSPRAPG